MKPIELKRAQLLAIMALSILSCQTNKQFTIVGFINGVPAKTEVYLVNYETGLIEDSIMIEEKKFQLRGKVPYPETFTLKLISDSGSQGFDLWVDNVEINLDGDWNDLEQMMVSGSTQNPLWRTNHTYCFFNRSKWNYSVENNGILS
ncbi:MAG: DUF4369 domain-containing protein [Fulvivirga sp.]